MTPAKQAIHDAWEIQSQLYARVLDIEDALFKLRTVIQTLESLVDENPSHVPQERRPATAREIVDHLADGVRQEQSRRVADRPQSGGENIDG